MTRFRSLSSLALMAALAVSSTAYLACGPPDPIFGDTGGGKGGSSASTNPSGGNGSPTGGKGGNGNGGDGPSSNR